jgi:hypothetical protein
LHLDAIETGGAACGKTVSFRWFAGISPKRYFDLIAALERKDSDPLVMEFGDINKHYFQIAAYSRVPLPEDEAVFAQCAKMFKRMFTPFGQAIPGPK